MSDPSSDRAIVIDQAWRFLELGGFKVVDRLWRSRSGEHELALVAITGSGTLIAVEVLDPSDRAVDDLAEELADDRVEQLRDAAAAWIAEDRGRTAYSEVRVDVIGFAPDGFGTVTAEHVQEVG
jgi:Holliday junction resolvase-like predicted endonuclease